MKIKDISLRNLSGSKASSGSVKNTADNLFSTDVVEVLIGVSEGPINGLKDGAKSFYIGDTPLQAETGDANFDDFELVAYKGSEQGELINSRLGGFGSSITVNTELAPETWVVRQGLHSNIDYLDVRYTINQLVLSNSKGTFTNTGTFRIEYKPVSAATWTPVKVVTKDDLLTQEVDAFFGQRNRTANVNATPGDRPTYVSSTAPITTADSGIWFNSANNFQPKLFVNNEWTLPDGLTFQSNRWTWTEENSWGQDKTTSLLVQQSVSGLSYEQGDYWINPTSNLAYLYNGSSWILAGSSLRPGTFGENGTGGTVTVNDGEITITGKTSSPFPKEFRIPVPNIDEPYMIRTKRITPVNTTESFFDIVWESFQEVTAQAYNFPGLSTVQVVARASEQFSSIPDFSGVWEGRIVRVPSNYDPVARTYTGVWDGVWKLAFSDNPAYVVYDLVMNDRYGMNAYYPITVNKWDVYEAGRWCDTRTADGQPRFTFNSLISDPRGGRDAINYICGIFGGRFFDDGNGYGVIKIDRDDSYVAVFSPENVVDGLFTYSFTETSTRYNDLTVTFKNPDLNWQEDRRRVYDQDHIDKFGRIPLNFIAVGCTNEKEAILRGRYKMITSLTETMMVNFKTNRLGLYLSPYDIILVSDEDMGLGLHGRVKGIVNSRELELRDALYLEPGFQYRVSFQVISEATNDFVIESRNISPTQSGLVNSLKVTEALPELPQDAVFTVDQINGDSAPMAFRILSISEADGDPDNISIQAIQVNRAKWYYVDGFADTIDDLNVYQLETRKKPKPPTDVIVKPSTRLSGGSLANILQLIWQPSQTPTVSRYKIYGSKDGGPFTLLAETTSSEFLWDPIPAGEYVFNITAVDVNAYESDPATIEHRFIGDVRIVGEVSSLRLVDEPSETTFESRSPLFEWAPSTDPNHQTYTVRVISDTDIVIREEEVQNNFYRYEYTINSSENGGNPRRSFSIAVASRDNYNFLSDFVTLSVQNQAPAAPTNLQAILSGLTALIKYDVPPIRDFQGAVIHASNTSGFTPSAGNLVYKGPNNNVSIVLGKGQTWYFRVALYDVFGTSGLNFSSEVSLFIPNEEYVDLTPPAPPTSVVSAASGPGFVVFNWVNSSDSDRSFVEVYYSTTNNQNTSKFGASSYGTSCIVSGLDFGQTYYFWLRTVDKNGNRSTFTSAVTGTPQKIGTTHITDGAVTTQLLAANSVVAEKLDVTDLSAVSANMGILRSGKIESTDQKFVIDLDNKTISITV